MGERMKGVVPILAALGLCLMYCGSIGKSPSSADRMARARAYLAETGWSWMNERVFVMTTAMCAVAGWGIIFGFSSNPFLGAAAGAMAATSPHGRVRSRRKQRRRERAEAWPDALAGLISGVRSGMSLAESCMALRERGPLDLRPAFERFTRVYRTSGSFDAAIGDLRQSLADPIADRVAVVLSMAHQVGGRDLVRVLRATSEAVREELRISNEVHARWSWTVTAARVAAAAPYLVVLTMCLRPEGRTAFASPGGTITLLLGTGSIAAGYQLMRRAARLPEEKRLLG